MARRLTSQLLIAAATLFGLAGCVQPPTVASALPGRGPATLNGTGAAPGARIAVLLPLSGPNATIGQGLLKGVQLAIGPAGPQLDVRDTMGTPTGATAAATAAVAQHDLAIVGPLTQAETAAVANAAPGLPTLAFTSDRQQARPGVWVLGITQDQQVARLVTSLQREGRNRIAAVLPDNIFGDALADALQRRTSEAGLPAPITRRYPTGRAAAFESAVRDLSGAGPAADALASQIRAVRALGAPDAEQQVQDLQQRAAPAGPPPFDALLLAELGAGLRTAAAVLPRYGIQTPDVRVVGPAQWARDAANLPGLTAAWYAAPDPAARTTFDTQYAGQYGSPPAQYADIAYDAGKLGRLAATAPGQLTQPRGFAGVDGPLVLAPDGNVRRGLAVFEVGDGGPRLIDPAPVSLQPGS